MMPECTIDRDEKLLHVSGMYGRDFESLVYLFTIHGIETLPHEGVCAI